MQIQAIKLYDKYWSLIERRSGSFGNIIWVEPNQSTWKVGEEVYLRWAGGEQLGDYNNIIYQQGQDFDLLPNQLIALKELLHKTNKA